MTKISRQGDSLRKFTVNGPQPTVDGQWSIAEITERIKRGGSIDGLQRIVYMYLIYIQYVNCYVAERA
jgi:hypothetical protein